MQTIRLYHSTRFSNLASILKMGVMTINNPHSEGHGDMLWFTTADDYGSEVRISIDVPQEEFDNRSFEFVNKIHVVTYDNIDIRRYNFKIDSFAPLYMESFGAYYGGFKGERLVRLANNEPQGVLEETVFKCFYQEYGNRKDIQTILNYIRNNSNNIINERKKMKQKVKITEGQLRQVIRESLRRIVLNESTYRGTAVYCPADRELDIDFENLPQDLADLMFKNYVVTFVGSKEDAVNPSGWGEGYPGSDGDARVVDDGGFGDMLNAIKQTNPEMVNELASDFQNWSMYTDIEWK